jgi:hypothetical protein
MDPSHTGSSEAGPSNQASTSSTLTPPEAVQQERETTRLFVLDRIFTYLETYEKEIKAKFPNKVNEIGTSLFVERFKNGIFSDYGDCETQPHTLRQLQSHHSSMKKEMGKQELNSYKKNRLYLN